MGDVLQADFWPWAISGLPASWWVVGQPDVSQRRLCGDRWAMAPKPTSGPGRFPVCPPVGGWSANRTSARNGFAEIDGR